MGHKHTELEKARISQALKGKPKSPEHKEALSIAMKGHHNSARTEFKKGATPFYKGKQIPPEVRCKLNQANVGKHSSAQSEFQGGQHASPSTEFKRGLVPSWIEKGLPHPNKSPSMRIKISHSVRKAYQENPDYRIKVSKATKRQMADLRQREHLSQLAKERVKDPEYMRKILCSRRPTDIEQIIMDVIEKYNLPYKYTGNGTFKVGEKYPDFVNVNGEKIAIDVFGERWHNPEEIPERKAIFAEYGWKLIIIWGHEIKELSEAELLEELRRR